VLEGAGALYHGPMLAGVILGVHLAVIGFNLFGLLAIPIGARLGRAFVHGRVFRLAHLFSMAVVALQAAAGRACFLTLWQDRLGGLGRGQPLIMRWVNGLIYWPLPLWAFTAVYLAAFAYVLALLWLVPLRPRGPA
jgi:hypothetical protein